jgi:hypothetical protein
MLCSYGNNGPAEYQRALAGPDQSTSPKCEGKETVSRVKSENDGSGTEHCAWDPSRPRPPGHNYISDLHGTNCISHF